MLNSATEVSQIYEFYGTIERHDTNTSMTSLDELFTIDHPPNDLSLTFEPDMDQNFDELDEFDAITSPRTKRSTNDVELVVDD